MATLGKRDLLTVDQVRRWCAPRSNLRADCNQASSSEQANNHENPFITDRVFVGHIIADFFTHSGSSNNNSTNSATETLCLHAHGHTASRLLLLAAHAYASYFDESNEGQFKRITSSSSSLPNYLETTCASSSAATLSESSEACTVLYQLSFAMRRSGLAKQVVQSALVDAVDAISTQAVDTQFQCWCQAVLLEKAEAENLQSPLQSARTVFALLVRAFPGKRISGDYLLQLLDDHLEAVVALIVHVLADTDTHSDVALQCVRILGEFATPQTHFNVQCMDDNKNISDHVHDDGDSAGGNESDDGDEGKRTGEYSLGSVFLRMQQVAVALQTVGISEVLADGWGARLQSNADDAYSTQSAGSSSNNRVLSHLLVKARDNVEQKRAQEPARSAHHVAPRESVKAVLVHHTVLTGIMGTMKAVMELQPGDGWDFRAYMCYGDTLRKLCIPYLKQCVAHWRRSEHGCSAERDWVITLNGWQRCFDARSWCVYYRDIDDTGATARWTRPLNYRIDLTSDALPDKLALASYKGACCAIDLLYGLAVSHDTAHIRHSIDNTESFLLGLLSSVGSQDTLIGTQPPLAAKLLLAATMLLFPLYKNKSHANTVTRSSSSRNAQESKSSGHNTNRSVSIANKQEAKNAQEEEDASSSTSRIGDDGSVDGGGIGGGSCGGGNDRGQRDIEQLNGILRSACDGLATTSVRRATLAEVLQLTNRSITSMTTPTHTPPHDDMYQLPTVVPEGIDVDALVCALLQCSRIGGSGQDGECKNYYGYDNPKRNPEYWVACINDDDDKRPFYCYLGTICDNTSNNNNHSQTNAATCAWEPECIAPCAWEQEQCTRTGKGGLFRHVSSSSCSTGETCRGLDDVVLAVRRRFLKSNKRLAMMTSTAAAAATAGVAVPPSSHNVPAPLPCLTPDQVGTDVEAGSGGAPPISFRCHLSGNVMVDAVSVNNIANAVNSDNNCASQVRFDRSSLQRACDDSLVVVTCPISGAVVSMDDCAKAATDEGLNREIGMWRLKQTSRDVAKVVDDAMNAMDSLALE